MKILVIVFLLFACGGRATYIKGDAPIGPLPEPKIVVTLLNKDPLKKVQTPSIVDKVDFIGKVKRLRSGSKPSLGFKMEIEGQSQEVLTIDVRNFSTYMPYISSNAPIKIKYAGKPDLELLIEDDAGVAFFLHSGSSQSNKVKDFLLIPSRALRFLISTSQDDLCRTTFAHYSALIKWREENIFVDPGTFHIFKSQEEYYLISIIDVRDIEDAQCNLPETPYFGYFIVRLKPSEGEKLWRTQEMSTR